MGNRPKTQFADRILGTGRELVKRLPGAKRRGFPVGRHHDCEAHAAAHVTAELERLKGSSTARAQLQLFHLAGKSESHPDATLRTRGHLGKVIDCEQTSRAGENRARLGELIENREELELHLRFIGDSFDDQVGIADGLFDRVRRY